MEMGSKTSKAVLHPEKIRQLQSEGNVDFSSEEIKEWYLCVFFFSISDYKFHFILIKIIISTLFVFCFVFVFFFFFFFNIHTRFYYIHFLICSVRSKSILPPVATSEDTNFISLFIKHGLFKNAQLTFLPRMVEM